MELRCVRVQLFGNTAGEGDDRGEGYDDKLKDTLIKCLFASMERSGERTYRCEFPTGQEHEGKEWYPSGVMPCTPCLQLVSRFIAFVYPRTHITNWNSPLVIFP